MPMRVVGKLMEEMLRMVKDLAEKFLICS